MLKWLEIICLNGDSSYLKSLSKIIKRLSDDLPQLKGTNIFSCVVKCWTCFTGC